MPIATNPRLAACWQRWYWGSVWRWHWRMGRLQATRVALGRWLALARRAGLAPHHPAVCHAQATRAHLAGLSGNWALAMRVLDRLVHAQPVRAAHWFNLGFVHQQLQDWPAAEAAFRQALNLAPGLDAAWLGLGQTLHAQADLLGAEEAWRQQVRLQPLCPDGFIKLFELALQTGQPAQAARWLDRLKAFEPRRALALEPLLAAATRAAHDQPNPPPKSVPCK